MEKKIFVPKFKKELGFETSVERSAHMRKIKSKDTKAEIVLRKLLWNMGIRYFKNYKKLPGSPDIVISKNKLAIFVDGEFWHGYNWEIKKTKIKANREFWIPKIERNIQRDRQNDLDLNKSGYTVLRFWEHQVKKDLEACIASILLCMNKNSK
jgi:DNA mismatch endonuclease (patch repair protein)